jgi:DNA replication and repair protein RecF
MPSDALVSLKLRDFRCYAGFETEFAPGLNLIVGPNARGKTSLLEAACVLLRLQSPRTARLAEVVRHEQRGFVVDGYWGARHLQYYFSPRRKKLALDAVEQKRSRHYLEVGRVVWFSMSDIGIVRGSSAERRDFLDSVAGQRTAGYRPALRAYERALRSRNLLLKAPSPRPREIEAFDQPLLTAGTAIMRLRAALVAELEPHAQAAHHAIGGAGEELRLEYGPGAEGEFPAALASAGEEDARLRQTTVGPHRDELRLTLGGRASGFASEGQQRTIVLALRLAAARLLAEHFGQPPLLLLDDIFGELDPRRRAALLATLPAGAQQLITLTTLSWVPEGAEARILRLGETS